MRVKRFINYNKYTLFMSHLAHEYKRLGLNVFIERYNSSNYRGIYQKYLSAYIEYLRNKNNGVVIDCYTLPSTLILDPYTYRLYFKCKDKDIINEELKDAIPEFLKQGLLITKVQEAVHASSTETIS